MFSRITHRAVTLLIFTGCSLTIQAAHTESQFEDGFENDAQWDFLDFTGDATIRLATDSSTPPGYGPEVLLFEGDHVVALAKEQRITEGTLVVLYRELEPRDQDADGILLFNAQYGDDLSVEHNTKTIRSMMWLEQDNDTGLHIRAKRDDAHEEAYAEQSGVGLVTDDWNKTGWIWQKVRIEGDTVSAKYWPAHAAEPTGWTLRSTVVGLEKGRIGFRIGSGKIAVAYFGYAPDNISPASPDFYLVPEITDALCGQPQTLRLFQNARLDKGPYTLSLRRGDFVATTATLTAEQLSRDTEHHIVIAPIGHKLSDSGAILITAAIDDGPWHAVLEDAAGNSIASCEISCSSASDLLDQLTSIEKELSKQARGESPTLHYEVAKAHHDLAAERIDSGDREGAEKSLRYAANALEQAKHAQIAETNAAPRIKLWRQNTIVETVDGPRVRIRGRIDKSLRNLSFRFFGADRLLGLGFTNDLAEGILVKPFFGEYQIVCSNPELTVSGECPSRILATVVETRDGEIFVNGEPFLVKGVNVHSLAGDDRERSLEMVRKLKRLGFNTLRGDYPPLWQVEMAYQENMAWSVLAPFSCASTDDVFAALDAPTMIAVRDKTQTFIDQYKEMPGVLLWNSCNEITNETTDFLVSIYPVYKHLDPYNRPVHYANLFGQDRWQGQDIMAVNYYFAPGQTPEDRHPLIRRSIDIAKAHNLPIIYTEYNSYHGPIPEKGVEAIYGLFDWGVQNGMSGGFLYDKWMSDRHPGVFDSDLNVDPGMEAAFTDVFADARIEIADRTPMKARLRIINKRPFTLRQFRVGSSTVDWERSIPDLAPGESIVLSTPSAIITDSSITGHMRFVTHYGFHCDVPFELELK